MPRFITSRVPQTEVIGPLSKVRLSVQRVSA
jgi:hypothetical protein